MSKKGFTLIEVIVVTLIIATLALLVAPSFKNSTMTTSMEVAKSGLVELSNAVKLYYEVNPSATNLAGILEETNLDLLRNKDTQQGYTYLKNGSRWKLRHSSATEYSLNGMRCQYTIGTKSANEIVSVKCLFKDDSDQEECDKFFIEKTNPAVIKKTGLEGESCENI